MANMIYNRIDPVNQSKLDRLLAQIASKEIGLATYFMPPPEGFSSVTEANQWKRENWGSKFGDVDADYLDGSYVFFSDWAPLSDELLQAIHGRIGDFRVRYMCPMTDISGTIRVSDEGIDKRETEFNKEAEKELKELGYEIED